MSPGKVFCASLAILLCCMPPMDSFAAPKPQRYPLKFELNCHGFDRIVYMPYAREAGLGVTYQEGFGTMHYWVDLTTLEYCTDKACSYGRKEKIAFMRGDRIVFKDNKGFETVNLATLQYDRVVQEVEGLVWAMKTKCRLSSFSVIK